MAALAAVGRAIDPGPISCPYSPECVEGEFYEVGIELSMVALCLWWKGTTRRFPKAVSKEVV